MRAWTGFPAILPARGELQCSCATMIYQDAHIALPELLASWEIPEQELVICPDISPGMCVWNLGCGTPQCCFPSSVYAGS